MEYTNKILKGAYLGFSSENDDQEDKDNNSSADVIENSPQSSPIRILTSGTQMGKKPNTREKISPITPKLLFRSQKINDVSLPDAFELLPLTELPSVSSYGVGDQSIEAPPYSPITPRMHNTIQCGDSSSKVVKVPSTASTTMLMPGDSSIETPVLSPLTPIFNLACPLPSPMPQMSPQTLELLNTLEGFEEFDSDDSVQDPDYYGENLAEQYSSDDGSDVSASIITTEVTIHVDGPNQTNTILDHTRSNPENGNIDPNPQATADAIGQESETIVEAENINESEHGRPPKGRKRKFGHTREEKKQRKYKNLSYVNYKKNDISPKIFIDFKCVCVKKCSERISPEERQTEFNKFYELGSYQAQNMYIVASVKEQPVKRPYVPQNSSNPSKKRSFSRQYFLKGIPVCREMFVKTIQTTPKRIDTALKKMRSDSISDKRGINGGRNKVDEECEILFINTVNKLPTYISHYCREKVDTAKFLRPDMTFSKIYQLYTEEANSAGIRVLSYPKAKQIFLTKFNLRTKPLNKDTCNKCDFYKNKKNLTADEETRNKIIEEHNDHLKTAEGLQKQLKSDMALAKTVPYLETITFDLEKTLPLPRIPTNIVFYKRQLWVYNLGIHTGSDDQGHCNVWVEGEAGRGSQEVGSCLIKHLERLKAGVTKLILWSDSCGGQNRNIKLTLMLKAFLNDHPTLQEIYIRFLESGHSFLPNDTDFGKVECALKFQQRVYLPEDYMHTMRTCKKNKPLEVHRMEAKDFFGSAKPENLITNRKKSITGEKISWLKTKEIFLKKEDMFSLFMRSSLECDYAEVDIKKPQRGRYRKIITKNEMEMLWPNGKPIPAAKLNDIRSLMHLIPRDAQTFYKKLTGDNSVEDDIDGFSGQLDFNVEDEDFDDNTIA